MRRWLALAVVLMAVAAPAAAGGTLTVRDIIELTRAGLGEDVLLALIEVDGGVYAIDPETLKTLKQAGVPDRVLVAMVRSGRERSLAEPQAAPAEPPPPPEPQVVVIDHHDPQPVREVMVPVPVYVAVPTGHRRFNRSVSGSQPVITESTFVPFQSGLPAVRPAVEHRREEPVYWGFGGKLRPDAWKPDGQRPEQPPREKK